jgi:hypothetical protein
MAEEKHSRLSAQFSVSRHLGRYKKIDEIVQSPAGGFEPASHQGPLRENIAEAGHTLRLLTRPFESGAPVTNLVFGYQRSKPKSPPIHQSILAIINLADSIYHIETNHPDAELT